MTKCRRTIPAPAKFLRRLSDGQKMEFIDFRLLIIKLLDYLSLHIMYLIQFQYRFSVIRVIHWFELHIA